jgi:hypothetical protein
MGLHATIYIFIFMMHKYYLKLAPRWPLSPVGPQGIVPHASLVAPPLVPSFIWLAWFKKVTYQWNEIKSAIYVLSRDQLTVDGYVWIIDLLDSWLLRITGLLDFVTRDYTLQITIAQRLAFSPMIFIALLGNHLPTVNVPLLLASRSHMPASISHQPPTLLITIPKLCHNVASARIIRKTLLPVVLLLAVNVTFCTNSTENTVTLLHVHSLHWWVVYYAIT